MNLSNCIFKNVVLPLQFEIQPIFGIRLAIDDTITSSVVQSLSYYRGDENYEFNCNGCSAEIKNLFVNAFKNSEIIAFQDYEGNLIKVILTELSIREFAGEWDIRGKMKRMPEFE